MKKLLSLFVLFLQSLKNMFVKKEDSIIITDNSVIKDKKISKIARAIKNSKCKYASIKGFALN